MDLKWELYSNNYYIEVEPNDLDSFHCLTRDKNNHWEQSINNWEDALFLFYKTYKELQESKDINNNVIYLFKDKYKIDKKDVYKQGRIIGVQSSLKIKNPVNTLLGFKEVPTTYNQRWMLFPLRSKEEAEKFKGYVWEIPLYWDKRLNNEFSRDFIFFDLINYSNYFHIYWNSGIEVKDHYPIYSYLKEFFPINYKSIISNFDCGKYSYKLNQFIP